VFPTTGILDDFNRADAGPPPSASWTTPAGETGLVVSGNQCESDAGGPGWGAWNTIASGADCEVYATAGGAADESWFMDLYARLQALGDFTSNYYCLSAYSALNLLRNLLARFLSYDQIAPGESNVGTMHYAPNSTVDYEWGLATPVQSCADDWYQFPNLPDPPNYRAMTTLDWGGGSARAHHKWWFEHLPKAAGSINRIRNNWWQHIIQANDLPPASPDEPLQAMTPRVLVVVYDPVMDPLTGERLTEHMGWDNTDDLIAGYIADVDECSGGLVQYSVIEQVTVDEFPIKTDGFRYTPATWLEVMGGMEQEHSPDHMDYQPLLDDQDLIARVMADEFDEVWLFGFRWAGFYESCMVGNGAFWINGPPIEVADCTKRFVIMGFSYETGVGEMLEDLGHRAELTLAHLLESAPSGHLLDLYVKATGVDLARIGRRTVSIADGDGIGMKCEGNKITAWHQPAGGAYKRIFIATDANVPGAGYLAANLAEAGHGTMDDFGGGTPVVGPAKLVVSPVSGVGGLTQNGLNWSWVWGSGAGIGIWAVQGIPLTGNAHMNMTFAIDTRGGNPTGPNWSRGAFRVQAEGEAGGQSPNVMGTYYISGVVDTLGVRTIQNGGPFYAPSATMYFVLRVWRTAPVLAGSYITGHLISFSWHDSDGVIAEYP
jgi:hypothetical protein